MGPIQKKNEKALHDVFGDNVPSYCAVKNPQQQLRLGNESKADEPCNDALQECDQETLTTGVSLLLAEHPRISLRSLEEESKVQRAAFHLVAHEKVNAQENLFLLVP